MIIISNGFLMKKVKTDDNILHYSLFLLNTLKNSVYNIQYILYKLLY